MKPILSVIIPTFNRQAFLKSAIESALSMALEGTLEIIVVDDGSTDNSRSIVQRIPYPIRYFYQDNKGVSSARNFGLANAQGKYIIFLDSDDILYTDKAILQIPILNTDPTVGVVYSKWRTEALDGTLLREVGVDFTPDVLPILLMRNIATLHACLFRTASIRAVGGFDEELAGIADWDLLLRLSLQNWSFAYIPRVTAVYRRHSNNMSSVREGMLNDALKFTKKTFQRSDLPLKYHNHYAFFKILRYLETIRRCLVEGDLDAAAEYFQRLQSDEPLLVQQIIGSIAGQISSVRSKEMHINGNHVHKVTIELVHEIRSLIESRIFAL